MNGNLAHPPNQVIHPITTHETLLQHRLDSVQATDYIANGYIYHPFFLYLSVARTQFENLK